MSMRMQIVENRYRKFYLLLLIFVIVSACVMPFNPELSKSDLKKQLVVEGRVTDEIGPFRVRLTQSDHVYNYQNLYNFAPVPDAFVDISDQSGNVYNLNYTDNGWYETEDKNLRGIIGNTYILHVNVNDGSQYESTPQQISEVADIDSVYHEEEDRTQITGKDVSIEKWLTVYLNTHAPSDSTHYFKWEFDETWEFNMPVSIDVVKYVFPPDCGGCKLDSMYSILVDVINEKSHCWVTEASKSILVKSTASSNVGEIEKFPVTSIGPGDDRLSIRYSILIKQYSLNREIFNFFKLLRDLNENNGSMYDKNPSPVNGNISCCDNGKIALGYFLASAVKSKRIFINNSEVHVVTGHNAYSACGWVYPPLQVMEYYPFGTIGSLVKDHGDTIWTGSKYCSDCRVRGTSVKPDFW